MFQWGMIIVPKRTSPTMYLNIYGPHTAPGEKNLPITQFSKTVWVNLYPKKWHATIYTDFCNQMQFLCFWERSAHRFRKKTCTSLHLLCNNDLSSSMNLVSRFPWDLKVSLDGIFHHRLFLFSLKWIGWKWFQLLYLLCNTGKSLIIFWYKSYLPYKVRNPKKASTSSPIESCSQKRDEWKLHKKESRFKIKNRCNKEFIYFWKQYISSEQSSTIYTELIGVNLKEPRDEREQKWKRTKG